MANCTTKNLDNLVYTRNNTQVTMLKFKITRNNITFTNCNFPAKILLVFVEILDQLVYQSLWIQLDMNLINMANTSKQ